MANLTHLNDLGDAEMVDITSKEPTARTATAEALVDLTPKVAKAISDKTLEKGDLFSTARIAGIQAAKRCSELIPLCHTIPISKISVKFEQDKSVLRIEVFCKSHFKTGVEMEALTAASVSALTIYDMCKGIDKGIVIGPVRLIEKTGGKSGTWRV
ncbi:cyclic pyranopterin monophosphate synthase MoaC [Gammaproteobacteria bacterium]|nr:cyclic pyranopterin monophosphate synthase MoaC [Gammaproteobacteria bacterium]